MADISYLSQFDLLQIRTRLQATARQKFDLLNPPALHAALAAPRQMVFGEEMREGVIAKAAILFLRLIQNHPFYDGNKRIAAEALRLFLSRNHVLLEASKEDLRLLANQVALGRVEADECEVWVRVRTSL